jgi:hypothetical protein
MQNITNFDELKNAIKLLEVEQALKRQLLKEQLNISYESLKPVNILRKTLKEITLSHDLTDNILGTASGLASGYLSKKIFIGASGNLFRKLIGSILQFGVTTVVSQHPDVIKSMGKSIIQYFFRKRETNSNSRDV